jgi:hypothetical protein
MIQSSLREHFLIDELQLGDRLNQALTQGRQSDFALLLALLSPDVQDQPWVVDPLPDPGVYIDWRQRFSLPRRQPIDAGVDTAERASALGSLLQQGGFAAVRLQECMEPDALIHRQFVMDSQVWDNLSPLTQEKHRLFEVGDNIVHEPLHDKPPAMLDSIEGAADMPDLKVHYFTHYQPLSG